MKSSDNLPLYKSAFDLAVYFEKIVKNFERYNKYTLGADLRNQSRLIAKQVVRIQRTQSRSDKDELLAQLEELKIIIRLTKEVSAFHNPNSYAYSAKLLSQISRQAQNWQSNSLTGNKQSEPRICAV